MPEGPEVWILSQAINAAQIGITTRSFGKHLLVKHADGTIEDWSFGLNGRVNIDSENKLNKVNAGWIPGDVIQIKDWNSESTRFGKDWMNASEEELQDIILKWVKSKKKVAGLMLEQSMIAGIGVAWGSEILFRADVRPDGRGCDQILKNLLKSMIEVREEIKKSYLDLLEKNKDNIKSFVNEWFYNLYDERNMKIYKVGSQVKVLGRNWWV